MTLSHPSWAVRAAGGCRCRYATARPGYPAGTGRQAQLGVLVAGNLAVVTSPTWEYRGSARERITPTVGLTVGWHDSLEPNRPTGRTGTVDVNGIAGQLVQTDQGSTYLTWQPPGAAQLIVTVLSDDDRDDQRAVAVRMAGSVRPDPRHTWVGPRFGWLPADFATQPWLFSLSAHDTIWSQSLLLKSRNNRQLTVTIGPNAIGTLPAETQPVHRGEERGLAGKQRRRPFLILSNGTEVHVQLDGARADLTHIAESSTSDHCPTCPGSAAGSARQLPGSTTPARLEARQLPRRASYPTPAPPAPLSTPPVDVNGALPHRLAHSRPHGGRHPTFFVVKRKAQDLVVRPGFGLVVGGGGLQAAVQDTDPSVGELT